MSTLRDGHIQTWKKRSRRAGATFGVSYTDEAALGFILVDAPTMLDAGRRLARIVQEFERAYAELEELHAREEADYRNEVREMAKVIEMNRKREADDSVVKRLELEAKGA
jgi:hypothetical protein